MIKQCLNLVTTILSLCFQKRPTTLQLFLENQAYIGNQLIDYASITFKGKKIEHNVS